MIVLLENVNQNNLQSISIDEELYNLVLEDLEEYKKKNYVNIKLTVLETLLKNNQMIINNIKCIRDKYLAHSDSKYFNSLEQLYNDFPVNISALELLIEESYKIIKYIYSMFEPIIVNDTTEEMAKELKEIVNILNKANE